MEQANAVIEPTAAPTAAAKIDKRPGAVVLLDIPTQNNMRPNFMRIAETVEKRARILNGYHVAAHPKEVNMKSVAHNLPDRFVPIYNEYNASTYIDTTRRINRQRALTAGVIEAALSIFELVMEDTRQEIEEFHIIFASSVYTSLIEKVKAAGVRIHMYTSNASMLRLANDHMPWNDFMQDHIFSAPHKENYNNVRD